MYLKALLSPGKPGRLAHHSVHPSLLPQASFLHQVQCCRYCLIWGLGQSSVHVSSLTPCSCATGSTSVSLSTSSISWLSLVFLFFSKLVPVSLILFRSVVSIVQPAAAKSQDPMIYSAPPMSCSHFLLLSSVVKAIHFFWHSNYIQFIGNALWRHYFFHRIILTRSAYPLSACHWLQWSCDHT